MLKKWFLYLILLFFIKYLCFGQDKSNFGIKVKGYFIGDKPGIRDCYLSGWEKGLPIVLSMEGKRILNSRVVWIAPEKVSLIKRQDVELVIEGVGRIYGEILGGDEDGEYIFFRNRFLGDLNVPINILKSVILKENTKNWRSEELLDMVQRDKEIILIPAKLGFDTITGFLYRFSKDYVFFAPEGEEEPSKFLIKNLGAIIRSVNLENKQKEEHKSLLFLLDGSKLRCKILDFKNGTINALLPWKKKINIKFSYIINIDFEDDNYIFLSKMNPVEAKEISWFGEMEPTLYTWKKDESCIGGPLKSGGMVWSRGIGCHAKSILKFNINKSWNKFMAYAAIDDSAKELPLSGNVDVRVEIDGKVVWQKNNIKAGDPPLVVGPIDIASCKTLTLVVDFGKNLHIGDRFNWLLPVLYR